MFLTKELGDYFKSKFIVKKYNDLNADDPDNIIPIYRLRVAPTFIFVDGDGKEVSRMTGAAADAKGLIKRIEETISKENTWAIRNERFKNDPSYEMEHITFLTKMKKTETNQIFQQVFKRKSIEANFNKESLDYYKICNVKSIKSFIFKYISQNKKEVIAVMGEDEFINFILSNLNTPEASQIYQEIFNNRSVEENFSKGPLYSYKLHYRDNVRSFIFEYMLDNKKEVMAVMGKDEYTKFLRSVVDSHLCLNVDYSSITQENYEKGLKPMEDHKILHTTYYKFLNDMKVAFVAKDFDTAIASANKRIKKASSWQRYNIGEVILRMSAPNRNRIVDEDKKDAVIAFFEKLIPYEDNKTAEKYNSYIDKINRGVSTF